MPRPARVSSNAPTGSRTSSRASDESGGTTESAFGRLPPGVKYRRPPFAGRENENGPRRAGGDAHDCADGRVRGPRHGDRLVGPCLRVPGTQRPADEGPRRADYTRGVATRERPGLLGHSDTGLPEPEASPADVRGAAQVAS